MLVTNIKPLQINKKIKQKLDKENLQSLDKSGFLFESVVTTDKFKKNNHIFNLSHGILPKTKISNIEKVIKVVRDYETSK